MLFSAASSCFEFSEAEDWLALLDAIDGLALAAATGLSDQEGI